MQWLTGGPVKLSVPVIPQPTPVVFPVAGATCQNCGSTNTENDSGHKVRCNDCGAVTDVS